MKAFIVIALAVLGSFYASAEPVCWNNEAEGQTHCYSLTTAMMTDWASAGIYCGEGSHLAGITSAAEQTFLNENLGSLNGVVNTQWWFGAKYETFTGDVWRWTTTSNEEVDLATNGITWNNGAPGDNDNAAILHNEILNPNWVFQHANPTVSHYFLCEAASDALLFGAEFVVTIDDGGTNRYYHGYTTDGDDEVTWKAANARCQELNANLARVDTDTLRISLQVQLTALSPTEVGLAKDFWIGLHRGEWRWSGGAAIEGYTNWATNEPKSIGCGYLEYAGANDAQWRSNPECEFMGVGKHGLCEEITTNEEPSTSPGPGDGNNGAPAIHLSLYMHLYIVAVIFISIFN